MDGDIQQNLEEILNSIYLSSTLQSDQFNSLQQYILSHGQDSANVIFNFLLPMLTSRSNLKYQKELFRVIIQLSNSKPELSSSLFELIIRKLFSLKDINPTKTISKQVYYYSKFLVNCSNWNNLNDESKKQLVEAQSVICQFYAKLQLKNLYEKNYKCLQKFLSNLQKSDDDNNLKLYLDIAKNLSLNSSGPINFVILWDNLVRFLNENAKRSSLIMPYKSFLIDLFAKNVISNKAKLSDIYDPICFKNIITIFTAEEFKKDLFPSMQRSILRNPEISLSLMIYVIEYLNFDLSDYMKQICEMLGNNLHAKNELLQEESLKAVKVVAKKCFKSEPIEFALTHFSKIYHGSEGKLTVLGQKHTIIKSIGHLSYNKSESNRQNLLNLAVEQLLKIFKQETIESSFVLIMEQLKIWIKNSPKCILPDQFWTFFKEFSKSKSSTPPVLSSMYECISTLLMANNEDNDKNFLKSNLEKIDDSILAIIINSSRNVSAAMTKIPLLTESLDASLILLKMYKLNPKDLKEKMKNFLSSLQNLDAITFLSDKFIAQASTNTLLYLIDFIYDFLNFNTKDITTDLSPIYKACIFVMCNPSKDVREKAFEAFNNYCDENQTFPMHLVRTFNKLFKEKEESEHPDNDNNENGSNKFKFQCCQVVLDRCEIKDINDIQTILDILHFSHHKFLFEQNSNANLFLNYLKKYKYQNCFLEMIETNFKIFSSIIFEFEFGKCSSLNLVKTLVKFQPHKISSMFVRRVSDNLEQYLSNFKSVSKDSYEIFKTPEGKLYNQSVVIEAGSVQIDKNLKRESKLYSHKEQLAEIQLRKELEAKNSKINQSKELDLSKLSKKQKEIYQQELEKEKSIRDRLKFLNQRFNFDTNVLLTIIETKPIVGSIHFKEIIILYVDLLSSILVHDQASKFFQNISHKMMVSTSQRIDGDYLTYASIITNLIINLYGPNEEPQKSIDLIKRVINYLYLRTCPNRNIEYDEKLAKKANNNRLTTPAFSFVFPILRFVFLNLSNNFEQYEDLVEKCLYIIDEHSKIRCYGESDLDNLKNPQNLPIKFIFETLLIFMEKDVGVNCDELISTTLIHVVNSVNNEMGCGKASARDIYVLINYLTHQDDLIRSTCFEGLFNLASNVLPFISDENCRRKLAHCCFVGQFDILIDCRTYSKKIFEICNFELTPIFLDTILNEDIENINFTMIQPVAEAYKTLIEQFQTELDNCFNNLVKFYQNKALKAIPTMDAFGRPLSKNHIDPYEPRLTIAHIFKHIVHLFNQIQVESFINFLIPQALSDNNESVRSAMLDAGCRLIDYHGKNHTNYLLTVFETFLDSAPDDHQNDLVRKSVIILMGTLAKHIDNDNPKLKPILSKLVEALSTPSQIVQEAVANCLQYLIPKFKDDAPALLQKLLEFLFESDIYGERKGAAYGIAGIVKGLGILSINKLGIMDALTQAIQAKDKPNNREGALFAFEMLSHMLRRLFEPYIVHILPYLLDCFGDSSTRVRHAADDTSKVIMSNLSAHGVTLIYPAILKALEDDSWRKKTSSIDLLGLMAYCAPKQLSQCLPKIVPKLMAVMTDSHPKVQKSAAQALEQIGSVIKNPEIQEIVPTLLIALQDPANKTNECLNVMMKTKFVHIIDPPSLALIMPVIQRAFQNRSTETRKMASQIVGNMYALAKAKDLSPYLPSIIPGLKNSLLDPVPEVRTATARALGAMVRSLGNEILDDLRPWLEKMLISDNSSVDRSGAAQGLAEVLGGLGKDHLDKYMPKILEVTENPYVPPHVKDGYIMLYIYLPSVFHQHFSQYISQVINPILKALADENEFVRETALRAGQRIVNMYAETAIQLLLPELESGLFDENWRIRYSSVQLLGDLLFKITGLSGKMTTESNHEDDNFGTEQSHQALYEALGEERRNRVLSGLYMGRSDVSLQVRQASLHVWKVIVPNTPRTLREILPVLFTLLLECLASNSNDRQQIGARTLGDLVRKLGERILPEIIPILEKGLKSNRADQREGVCIGLSEIISSTSREMVQAYADNFISTVRKALFDPLPEVREAAARTFDQLHSAIGEKALTDILSHLLDNIDHPQNGERVLFSLKNIMSYKSKVILPNLIPKLLTKPVNTRALSFISSVAGDGLSKHLHTIIPPLLSSLSESFGDPKFEEELEYCRNIIGSIDDEDGVRTVIFSLFDFVKSEDLNTKRATVALLSYYTVQKSKQSAIIDYIPQLTTNLIDLLQCHDEFILNQAIEALTLFIKNMESHLILELAQFVLIKFSQFLEDAAFYFSNFEELLNLKPCPGFRTNKGILPLVHIFNKALLSNNSELKHTGAEGYEFIVVNSSPEALTPSVMVITGPLLRCFADRGIHDVKVISMNVLSILLLKIGNNMKPFFPQIQMFFFRSLKETDQNLRVQAAMSIGRFARVHTKLDSFIHELIALVDDIDSQNPFKVTGYYAIRLSVMSAGGKISPENHRIIFRLASEEKSTSLDTLRITAASCIGSLCAHANDALMDDIFFHFLLADNKNQNYEARLFNCCVLKVALKEGFNRLMSKEQWSHIVTVTVMDFLQVDRFRLTVQGIKCAGYFIHQSLLNNRPIKKEFLQTYIKLMNHQNNDVKHQLLASILFWSKDKSTEMIPDDLLKLIVPQLVNGTKEKSSRVRAFSELALVSLLKLKYDDDKNLYQRCYDLMNEGANESFQECVSKIRNKIAKDRQHYDRIDEEFDDTILYLLRTR